MTELTRRPASAGVDEICEIVTRDGAMILEGAISRVEVDQALSELMPYIEKTPVGSDDFTGKKTTRTGALVARSATTRSMITHSSVLASARQFLAPFCERVQLHLSQVIRIQPGAEAQLIHRDRWAWGTFLDRVEPQFNTIWALTDFRKENGATIVVPGSTGWEDARRPEPDEVCYAEMDAGSVLLYSGAVLHGGGFNASDGDRIGVNLTYALGWLRQEENQYLACPPEIARDLDPELQDLIGYTLGNYALGYYTPPLPPGAGPEIVGPEFSLGRGTSAGEIGSAELRDLLDGRLKTDGAPARESN